MLEASVEFIKCVKCNGKLDVDIYKNNIEIDELKHKVNFVFDGWPRSIRQYINKFCERNKVFAFGRGDNYVRYQ